MSPTWFRVDTRKVIAGFIDLDNQAARFAALRAVVPAYRTEAIETHDVAVLNLAIAENEWVMRVEPHPSVTVRGTAQHFIAVADEIVTCAGLARLLAGAVDRVRPLLQFPPIPSDPAMVGITIETAGRLAAAATVVAQLGRCHPTWFDAIRRQTLKSLAKELSDEHARWSQERQQFDPYISTSSARAA